MTDLQRFLAALGDPQLILGTWREKDLFQNFGEDGLRVSLGPAASPHVTTAANRYEATTRRSFPAPLREFLWAHDGMNVEATSEGGIHVVEEVGFDVTNGLLPAARLESDETSDFEDSALCIGTVYGQARLLLIDEGERSGLVVFEDGEGPVTIASSMAELFRELAENGLSIEAVVSRKI